MDEFFYSAILGLSKPGCPMQAGRQTRYSVQAFCAPLNQPPCGRLPRPAPRSVNANHPRFTRSIPLLISRSKPSPGCWNRSTETVSLAGYQVRCAVRLNSLGMVATFTATL